MDSNITLVRTPELKGKILISVLVFTLILLSTSGFLAASALTTSTNSTSTSALTGSLPSNLTPYSSIITIIILFVSGLLIGIGVKKALTGAILVIVGLVIAGFSGLAIPFLNPSVVMGHVITIFQTQITHLGPVFFSFPIFWIIGLAIGLWRG